MSALASKQIVVVLGVGPGTGLSVARAFANAGHPVALLSRSLDKLQVHAQEINKELGDSHRAKAFAADATSEESIRSAFNSIKNDAAWKGKHVYSGIFNPTAGFHMGKFAETSTAALKDAFNGQALGGFVFAQEFIKALKEKPDWQKPPADHSASGVLLFTGATASVRGSAGFSAFAASKSALRAISQSIAREYGPQGVHVAHVILDGAIATERVAKMMHGDFEPDTRLEPDAIAQVFVDLARQRRSAWSHEIDLRPFSEKF